MQLDRVAVALRPRKPLEAFDLGTAMLRHWSGPVAAAWLVTVVPVCAVVLIAIPGFWTAWFVLWLLRPLFELVPVVVLSRALFGAAPTLQQSLAEIPRAYLRAFRPSLLVHRLAPWRALAQPVALLEGERGARRRRRESDVLLDSRGSAWLNSGLCVAIEWSVWAQLLLLLVFFTPGELLPDLEPLSEWRWDQFEPGWLVWAAKFAWLVAYSLAGSLNAAGGFALYVNRRTLLEGWDIELVFRRLAARAQRLVGKVAGAVLLVIVALWGGQARGQESAPAAEPGDPARVVREVLAHDDFDTTETRRRLDLDIFDSPANQKPLDLSWVVALLQVLGWALLVALLVAIALAIARTCGWIDWRKRDRALEPTPLTHVFGLDVRPESLPEDIAAKARELWLAGDSVGAMGLLYRAALSRLIASDGLALEPGDTESDCLARVRALGAEQRADYFKGVTGAWLVCAYSRTRPADATALALCEAWREHFERGTA